MVVGWGSTKRGIKLNISSGQCRIIPTAKILKWRSNVPGADFSPLFLLFSLLVFTLLLHPLVVLIVSSLTIIPGAISLMLHAWEGERGYCWCQNQSPRCIKSCSHVYIGCLYYPQQRPHQEQSKKAARCLRMFKLTRTYFHCEQKENCYFISPQKIWFYLQDCIVTINHVFPPTLTCGDRPLNKQRLKFSLFCHDLERLQNAKLSYGTSVKSLFYLPLFQCLQTKVCIYEKLWFILGFFSLF